MEAEITLDYDRVPSARGRGLLLMIRVRASAQTARSSADKTSTAAGREPDIAIRKLTVTGVVLGKTTLGEQLSPYEEKRTGGQIVYYLGELSRDGQKTLLVEMSVPPGPMLGEAQVALVRLEYDEVGANAVSAHQTQERKVLVYYVSDDDAARQIPDSGVVKAHLLFQVRRIRQDAIRAADSGNYQTAVYLLAGAADTIEEANLGDAELQVEYDRLRKEAADMEHGAERYGGSRKVGTAQLDEYDSPHTRAPGEASAQLPRTQPAIERGGPTPLIMKWKGSSLKLTMNLLRFGRAEDNDLSLPDEKVSRYHCQIVREEKDLYLYDLNSRNGTFANGGLVMGRFRLSAGDVVTIGSWMFRFDE